jgi:hypothetical protein
LLAPRSENRRRKLEPEEQQRKAQSPLFLRCFYFIF